MSFILSESKLRQMIREEILESFNDASMNPRGLGMTPEERAIQQIQQILKNSPSGKKLFNDLVGAVSAQLGPAAKDPAKVGALLNREVEKVETDGLSEGDGAARDYLGQQRANALGDRQQAISNIATGAAIGGIGYLLASLADVSGMPLDNVITFAKYIIPTLAVSSISSEIGAARDATKRAKEYTRILKGQKSPPHEPGRLKGLKI